MSHSIEHGMVAPAPEHLLNWIEANRADMRPPVSNKYLYDGQDFFAMCIAGPNARNDFHITDSEEFFLQLQGDIVVTLLEEAGPRHVRIREGETFMIPGGVPHAPQRPPNTLGLVIERRRPPGEQEALRFVCDSCGAVVEDLTFDCADIVEHFREAMLAFWDDEERSTCQCGTRVMPAQPIARIDFEPEVKIVREGEQ